MNENDAPTRHMRFTDARTFIFFSTTQTNEVAAVEGHREAADAVRRSATRTNGVVAVEERRVNPSLSEVGDCGSVSSMTSRTMKQPA